VGLDDYIKKIDVITEKLSETPSSEANEDSKSGVFREYLGLLFSVIIDIVKAPLKLLSNFLKKELLVAIKKDAKLYCMTELYDESIDFSTWYYKNDPTHVFFYQLETLQWIKQEFNFIDVSVKNRLISFKN